MTFFLNAAGTALLGVGLLACALWVRDINHLPFTKTRFGLLLLAAVYHFGVASAWAWNGLHRVQSDYGKAWQSLGWLGRGVTGFVLVWWTLLSYRTRRLERSEAVVVRAKFLELTNGS